MRLIALCAPLILAALLSARSFAADPESVPKQTAQNADVQILQKWADQGDAKAQNSLGVMYEQGLRVNKDLVQAANWYRKAADQGLADAQCNLGFAYSRGAGVDKDPAQAVAWYRKAAEQGSAQAQLNLAVKYTKGEGGRVRPCPSRCLDPQGCRARTCRSPIQPGRYVSSGSRSG